MFPQAEFTRVDPDELVTFVQRLEGAGYDHLLVYDHVLGADSDRRPGWDGAYDHRDPFLEPLVLFAYLARACTLEFVTGVMVLPQRQTALVAKQVATLALLAPGRLRLGVGLGWNEVEYQALGVDFAGRAARMEEQIALLRRLWTEPTLDHAGRFDEIEAAGLAPLPAKPVPIWIGCGEDPRALARVGRVADGWLPLHHLQPGRGFEDAWEAIGASARSAGRDPSCIGVEGHVSVRVDSLDRVSDRLARWADIGVGSVAVNPLRAGVQWPEHLDLLLRAAERMKP